MAANIFDWSVVAANNSNADADLTWSEGQAPSTVNNSARVMMQRVRQLLTDIGGSIAAGGTANGLTVTASSGFTAYADGQIIAFRATASNTGAATLNVNGIGAKAIRKMNYSGDVALAGGEIINTGIYIVQYSAALNGAAGAWLLVGAASLDTLTLQGAAIASAATTDIGAATGRYVHITGSVTITGFGTKAAGVVRELVFDAAPLITYNATSLILPGAANIQAAAGDTAIMVSEGSGNWRCTNYQRNKVVPDSGAWTPTLTNVSNAPVLTANVCFYQRIGQYVQCSGIVSVDPISAGSTSFSISLPIASNFSTLVQAAGVVGNSAGDAGSITSDATNDVAVVSFMAADATNRSLGFSFGYNII